MAVVKDIINWKYERASWQWDVLCLLCLVFIFLTPKEWFNKPNPPATQQQTSTVSSDGSYRDLSE